MKKTLTALILMILTAQVAWGAIYANRKQALKMAFPGADTVEKKTYFLTDAQIKKAQQISHQKISSKLFTFFIGRKNGKTIGYAAIDSHIVRTMPEVFMVSIALSGKVNSVHVLSFSEPPEYLPTRRWFKQFWGKILGPDLKLRRDIQSVTGSTMSSRAITAGVRKILALYYLLVKKESPPLY